MPVTLDLARRSAHLGLLLLMGTMWGLQFAMLKLAATSGHAEIEILLLTLLALSLIFGTLLWLRGGGFRLTRARLEFLLVTGLLGYVLPLTAALYAAAHIPAGVLALLASLTPVVAVGLALVLRTERVSPPRILAVALGALAVVLVFWPQLELPQRGAAAGMLLALVVPLCYGGESIYVAARWPRGLGTLQLVTGEAVVAALLLLPVFALAGGRVTIALSWSPAATAITVFVLAGVVETFSYFYLISRTGGVLVSFGSFVSLFAGIAWGVFLFDETHAPPMWVAAVALLGALALLALEHPPAPRHAAPSSRTRRKR